jgi:hypothetical protein
MGMRGSFKLLHHAKAKHTLERNKHFARQWGRERERERKLHLLLNGRERVSPCGRKVFSEIWGGERRAGLGT